MLSHADSKKRLETKALLAIVVLGLILRGGWLAVNYRNEGWYWGISLNEADMGVQLALRGKIGVYDPAMADALHGRAVAEKRLVDPEDLGFRNWPDGELVGNLEDEIGLGVLMGVIWWALGSMRFIYIQILQVLIDAACNYMFYCTAKNLAGDSTRIGLVAGLIYALYPLQVYMVSFPVTYVWPVFLSVVLLYLLSRYFCQAKVSPSEMLVASAAIGLMIGSVTYIRSTVLLLGVSVAVALVMFAHSRYRWGAAAIVLIVQMAVLVPLVARNYEAFGELRVTRGVFWHSLWVGFGEHKNPFGIIPTDNAVAESVLAKYPHVEKYGPAYEAILKQWTLEAIHTHPYWFIGILFERLVWLVFPQGYKSLLALPLFALASLGAVLSIRWYKVSARTLALLAVPSAYFFFSTIMVFPPAIKYVMPGYPYLLLLGAVAGYGIILDGRVCSAQSVLRYVNLHRHRTRPE